jgi:hypothetical protein
MNGLGSREAGSEPSGNGGFAPVGITLLMGAKKLHMPAVGDSLVRARGAAASASENAGPLLKGLVERLREVVAEAKRPRDMEDGMESFWNRDGVVKHDDFVKWLAENPDGYFINCRTASDMMLHRPSCHHLIDEESLTSRRKVCSLDRDQLVRWAKKRGTLEFCPDCP